MAEEFHAAVCGGGGGGGWWNMRSSRSVLAGGSPCSTAIAASNDMGWGLDMVDMKTTTTRSCDQDSNSFQTSQKPQQQQRQQQTDSDHSGGSSSSVLIDSTLQMMGFGLQSSSDWNPALLSSNGEDSSVVLNNFTGMNQEFCLDDQQRLNSINTPIGNCTSTCQGLSAGLIPISTAATASYGYTTASTLIQSLFEPAADPQQSLINNRPMNYPSNYGTHDHLNDQLMSASWPKLSPNNDNYLKPSLSKQLQPTNLHFTNNTPFWNASSGSGALNDNKAGHGFLQSTQQQAQFLGPTRTLDEKKPNCSSLTTKVNTEEVRESVNKGNINEPAFKRPRIETPSPLPTFKVRKEKLGDRITALQQLVSPFGKTDTASVLHEAIEYIKFLHDQVNVLSTPYLKNGHPIQQVQQSRDKLDSEGIKHDLKSRGLCLVPISSTFPVANETTADFWTPTFGGTFR